MSSFNWWWSKTGSKPKPSVGKKRAYLTEIKTKKNYGINRSKLIKLDVKKNSWHKNVFAVDKIDIHYTKSVDIELRTSEVVKIEDSFTRLWLTHELYFIDV